MTKNKVQTKVISDAPESNAGDDFHVLWAARKSLELLKLGKTNLKRITVEGPDPKEGNEIDVTGVKLLSIDLGEYYGGDSLKDSDKVVFSQLKYSTRRSNLKYTLARICEGEKPILQRLATTFSGYLNKYGRELVLQKLTLKLVSNRPCADDFLKMLNRIQAYLKSMPDSLTKHELIKYFPNDETDLNKLFQISKLKSVEFVDFLRVLDFEDCKVGSRFSQKQKIIETLGRYDSYELKNQYNKLYMLINSKMLPETRSSNWISLETLLAEFVQGSIDSLFPAPNKLESHTNLVERQQLSQIALELQKEDKSIYCLHGGAGIGKSTIARSINNYLPENSITIIYDCYGQGTYFDESSIRHTYQNALTQISNDLAIEVGSPLLLSNGLPEYSYVSEFRTRLEIATEILRKAYPSAFLSIVIDAADNSVSAAKIKNDNCFVQGLASLENLPEGCNLIFTARTHRIDSLNLHDSTTVKIPVNPFDIDETKLFLTAIFPTVTASQIEEFHTLTHQTPRVQAYATLNRNSLDEVFDFLKPYGKSVDKLIMGQIDEAKKKIGESEKVDSLLKAIINLQRPIPIDILSLITSIPLEEIRDFCLDSVSGIVIENDKISFRDEDFENYLRDKYPPSKSFYSHVSGCLLNVIDSNDYASSNIGMSLFHSERYEELRNLVLKEEGLDSIIDPLKKREVFVKRARYALQSCAYTQDEVMFHKLLLLCAEASKVNKIKLNLIFENINLVAKFSDTSTIKKLFFDITSNIHFGATNLDCASIFARKPETQIYAKRHLSQFEIWLEMRRKLPEHELREYNISWNNIASGAEAILRIGGVLEAQKWLKGWKPKDNLFFTLKILIKKLVECESSKMLQKWLNNINRPDVLLIATVELTKHEKLHKINLASLALRWQNILKRKKISTNFQEYIIAFCEILATNSKTRYCANDILSQISPILPNHIPRFYGNYGKDDYVIQMDVCFRHAALRKILSNKVIKPYDFLPIRISEDIKKNKDTNDYKRAESDKKEFESLYSKLLPIYALRAKIIVHPHTRNIKGKVEKVINSVSNDYSFTHRSHDIKELYNHVIGKLADITTFISNKEELISVLQQCSKKVRTSQINTGLTLATAAAKMVNTHEIALRILSDITNKIDSLQLSASEEIEKYIACSYIATKINQHEGEAYFQMAVESASKIDIEAYQQIDAIFDLSTKVETNNGYSKLAYDLSRFVEYCSIRLDGYDKFPWFNALTAIGNLDYPTAMATWCKWDQKDYVVITDFWSTRLIDCIEKGYLTNVQAAGLSGFNLFDYKWEELMTLLLNNCDAKDPLALQLLQEISRDIQTICQIDSRKPFLDKILPVLKESNLKDIPEVQKLITLDKFLSKNESTKSSQHFNRHYERTSKEDKKIEKLIKKLITSTSVSNVNNIQESLRKLKGEDFNQRGQNLYLKQLIEKCTNTEYVNHLNAYIAISPGIVSYHAFFLGLKERIDAWDFSQTVKKWKKESFIKIIERFFADHSNDNRDWTYLSLSGLYELADLFEKSKEELANAVKLYFTEHIDRFSAEELYQSIGIFKELISEKDVISVLEWIIGRWNQPLGNDIGSGVWIDSYTPPIQSHVNFAHYLRYCLGHPYKAIRWRAAHAIRRLAYRNENDILDILINNRNQTDNGVFSNINYHFYWLSSKLWLFMVLDSVAAINPSILLPYSKDLLSEALKVESGHALIRYYAKSICLKLLKKSPKIYSKKDEECLRKVLVSQHTQKKTTDKYDTSDESDSLWKEKFPFDGLDTLPYWYEPLGRIFNLSRTEIARRAENYICDVWGYNGDPYDDDKLNVGSHDYYSTSNRHGSIPSIENLRRYYEYHAMFYVANDLIENEPTIEEDLWDSWEGWMNGWIPTHGDKWLADLRDPTPLEKKFWEFAPSEQPSEDWINSIKSEDFNKEIFLKRDDGYEWVIIDGGFTRYKNESNESVHISSALVSKKNAQALMAALQTCNNPHDFKLPEENEDQMEISQKGFDLRGWLKTESTEDGKEEQIDFYTMTLHNSITIPGDFFNSWANIEYSPDKKSASFCDSNRGEGSIFEFKTWTDVNEKARFLPDFGTVGSRLIIRKDVLKAFLSATNYDLIIECQLNRYFKQRYEEKHEGYTPPKFKIYLIHSNGTVETTIS